MHWNPLLDSSYAAALGKNSSDILGQTGNMKKKSLKIKETNGLKKNRENYLIKEDDNACTILAIYDYMISIAITANCILEKTVIRFWAPLRESNDSLSHH